jgi:hypothetical protein
MDLRRTTELEVESCLVQLGGGGGPLISAECQREERAHGLANHRDGRLRIAAVVAAMTVLAGEEEDGRGGEHTRRRSTGLATVVTSTAAAVLCGSSEGGARGNGTRFPNTW